MGKPPLPSRCIFTHSRHGLSQKPLPGNERVRHQQEGLVPFVSKFNQKKICFWFWICTVSPSFVFNFELNNILFVPVLTFLVFSWCSICDGTFSAQSGHWQMLPGFSSWGDFLTLFCCWKITFCSTCSWVKNQHLLFWILSAIPQGLCS